MIQPTALTILLVEDDAVDVKCVKRAFRQKKIANPIVVASDGIEALAILRGDGGSPPLPEPYLILLDVNMPRMNGLEFLGELRADPRLQKSIVFALSTSRAVEDREAAYAKNVAGYIVKSNVAGDFLELVEALDHYWKVIEFPGDPMVPEVRP